MVDLYIRDLEAKIAQYEAIMSRCPQCKTTLSSPEAESNTASSLQTRSSRPAQQTAAKAPPATITGPSKRTAPALALSSSARSSKQLRPGSRIEIQASDLQQRTPPVPLFASSNRSDQGTEAPGPTLGHPPIIPSGRPTTRSVTSTAAGSTGQPATSPESHSGEKVSDNQRRRA